MTRTYKLRTMDEAVEVARIAFKGAVAKNLSKEEMDEFAISAVKSMGSPSEHWEVELGYKPNRKLFYEVHLYKPGDECPYIEKSYAMLLVPRERDKNSCEIIWKPEL